MIRGLLFKVVFYPLLGFWLLGLCAMLLRPGRQHIFRGFRRLVAVVRWLLRHIAGIRMEFRGLENLPDNPAYIFSAKHASTLDAVAVFILLPEFTAIAKQELMAYPLLGPVLKRFGFYGIDRASGNAHKETPAIAQEVLADPRPLLVFPEGTRVREGESKKLRSGAYHISRDSGLPVITMASNAGYLWPVHRLAMRPGTAIFEVHPPMPEDIDKEAYMAELYRRVIERSEALRREVAGPTDGNGA